VGVLLEASQVYTEKDGQSPELRTNITVSRSETQKSSITAILEKTFPKNDWRVREEVVNGIMHELKTL